MEKAIWGGEVMTPVAKNCDTDVRVYQQRFSDGMVRTQITAKATHPMRLAYAYVEMLPESRKIDVEFMTMESGTHLHAIPWSSEFPHEPTLGEMIEAAESLARAEWFKLFPEHSTTAPPATSGDSR